MITYRKKFIRIMELWEGESPAARRADLVRWFQRPEPYGHAVCREFHTILLDLTTDPDALFTAIKRGTRYEIRRAQTADSFSYEFWDARQQPRLIEFCDFYDRFASQKHLPPLDRRWLTLMAKAGVLEITRVGDEAGETLSWHAYHRNAGRVTLLSSASLFRAEQESDRRNRIGRANRFHHWEDMTRFRAEGHAIYDFGGWYHGSTDRQRLSINKFKEEFGGRVVRNYICEQALTIKGRLFLEGRRFLLGDAI